MSTSSISNNLRNALSTIDFSSIDENIKTLKSQYDTISKTLLGSNVGEIKGGVEALTKEIDIATNGLTASFVPTISKISKDIEGIKSDLIQDVNSSLKSDLNKLTSSTKSTSTGFLKDIISAGTPEAISKSIESSVGKNASDIDTTLQSLTNVSTKVSSLLGTNLSSPLFSSLNKLQQSLNNVIKIKTDFKIVDFVEEIERRYENSVQNLVDKTLSKSEIATTMNDLANNDYTKAFAPIVDKINKPENYDDIIKNKPKSEWSKEILDTFNSIAEKEVIFNQIRVEISEYNNDYTNASNNVGLNTLNVKQSGNSNTFKNGIRSQTTNGRTWTFEAIESIDELDNEFRNIYRSQGNEIAGATVHWSASFLDQNVDASWVDRIHKTELNAIGCGYHILILRDGTLQRGRPMNLSGAHDINHNQHFLGFCFIGGINQYSKNAKKPFWKYSSAKSFTPAQFKSYETLIGSFHDVFPYAQICGHYMTSNNGKMDPGFDVVEYSKLKFGHYNVFDENDSVWKRSNEITIDTINERIA